MLLTAPPLSLYLHYPWCVRKCPYCDFNSFTLHDELPEQRYVDALKADLTAQRSDELAQRPIVSVFMGGGTPSLFSPRAIGDVIDFLRAQFRVDAHTEITLEANPGTVERGRFVEYRAAGINRVSLGAQTFDAQALKVLGRIHGADDVRRSAAELHAAGLDNFNLDLMFALPGQLREGALEDLREALALEPAHLSHYQLTLEPGTAFAAAPPVLPDDDLAWDMQRDCHEELGARGFEHYEISGFAKRGHRCAHNLNYWTFGDYLGAGAGAHGKLSWPDSQRIERTTQQREPRRFLARAVEGLQRRVVPTEDLPFEYAMNALRLMDGFDLAQFVARTGLGEEHALGTLDELERKGLMGHADDHWRPTPTGFRFLNDCIAAFLPTPKSQAVAGS